MAITLEELNKALGIALENQNLVFHEKIDKLRKQIELFNGHFEELERRIERELSDIRENVGSNTASIDVFNILASQGIPLKTTTTSSRFKTGGSKKRKVLSRFNIGI